MRVYHGTSARCEGSILTDGLRQIGGIGPFVTTDERRAVGYGVRACCVDLHSDPHAAMTAVVFVLDVDDSLLRVDPDEHVDYLLDGGIAAGAILRTHYIDALPWIGDDDPAMYADLAGRARDAERAYGYERFATSGGVVTVAPQEDDTWKQCWGSMYDDDGYNEQTGTTTRSRGNT